jgi:hypothetical protein
MRMLEAVKERRRGSGAVQRAVTRSVRKSSSPNYTFASIADKQDSQYNRHHGWANTVEQMT